MPADTLSQLPIQAVMAQLVTALTQRDEVVLQAPPGAGKTTAVPLALIDQPWLKGQKILLLQPRRIAAKTAALRLAANLKQPIGQRIGYRMRMQSKVSSQTQLEVITEGVLTRMLQEDPSLEGVGLIIFDEFHERSLNNDLNLALALQSRELFRDEVPLKLLIMSATLDRQASLAILGDAPVVHSEGKSFAVNIIHAPPLNPRHQAKSIEERTVRLCEQALTLHNGSVLVFLPGQREIERCLNLLAQSPACQHIALYPLYANLPFEQQQQAITPAPAGLRKIVLATNIAETSITIDGVEVVIDSGLCRRAIYDVSTSTTRLNTQAISRASSIQRAGRAGRTAAGTCYRLWSEEQQQSLAPFETPEIRNADLSALMLNLVQWGCSDASELHWLDTPSDSAQQQALDLLTQLQAIERHGKTYQLSLTGKQLCKLPLSPRLGLICVLGTHWGHSKLACHLAALLSEGDSQLLRQGDINHALLKLEQPSKEPALKRILRLSQDYQHHCQALPHTTPLRLDSDAIVALLISAAWPERVAQRREGEQYYKLANGRSAQLSGNSKLSASTYLAVAHCSGVQGRDSDIIQLACELDIALLATHLPALLSDAQAVYWDEQQQRFCAEKQQRCGKLVLASRAITQIDPEHKRAILLSVIRKQGLKLLPWTPAAEQLCSRVNALHQYCEEGSGWPDFSSIWLTDNLEQWLAPHLSDDFVKRANTLKSLKKLDLLSILMAQLSWPLPQQLDSQAPLKNEVPSGSRIAIDYTQQPPVLAVKLQEMFGCSDTPRIATQCRARQPQDRGIALQLHLLSPAGRALQITQDLANFWHTSYFDVCRDMKGRYPKHPWPDDPMNFTPTRKTKAKLAIKK